MWTSTLDLFVALSTLTREDRKPLFESSEEDFGFNSGLDFMIFMRFFGGLGDVMLALFAAVGVGSVPGVSILINGFPSSTLVIDWLTAGFALLFVGG